ncbi:hypothetical protein GF351_04880 [Candidatus Woesearchaeota archaeon]|nr:hypothetical protein [Candidatus Woesearchaeota archaeon]
MMVMRPLRRIQQLKDNRLLLTVLIILNTALVMRAAPIHLKHYLVTPAPYLLFAPLCDMLAALFLLSFAFYNTRKSIPPFLAVFTFFSGLSYALSALVFYPGFVSWAGLSFSKAGAFFWVIFYGFQALVISDQLEFISAWKYALMVVYYVIKDYLFYWKDIFYYFALYDIPLWVKRLTLPVAVMQLFTLYVLFRLSKPGKIRVQDSRESHSRKPGEKSRSEER